MQRGGPGQSLPNLRHLKMANGGRMSQIMNAKQEVGSFRKRARRHGVQAKGGPCLFTSEEAVHQRMLSGH